MEPGFFALCAPDGSGETACKGRWSDAPLGEQGVLVLELSQQALANTDSRRLAHGAIGENRRRSFHLHPLVRDADGPPILADDADHRWQTPHGDCLAGSRAFEDRAGVAAGLLN